MRREWLLAFVLACGCGKSYWLGQYHAQVEKGTARIAAAKDDAERALGYAQRARGYGEQARYLRAFRKVSLAEYESIFDRAMLDHHAAVRLDPANAELYVARGLTAYDRAFPAPPDTLERATGSLTWRAGALADFDRALELDPRNQQALDRRGLIREQAKDWDAAEHDYTALAAVDSLLGKSRLAGLFCVRGGEERAAEHLDLAAADYERAIALDVPSDGCDCDPYAAAAGTYLEMARYDPAWDVVRRAEAKHRGVPDELVAALVKASGRAR